MEREFEAGDWVRFYRNGQLIIGQVEYVVRLDSQRVRLSTTAGEVRNIDVLEVRPRSN